MIGVNHFPSSTCETVYETQKVTIQEEFRAWRPLGLTALLKEELKNY